MVEEGPIKTIDPAKVPKEPPPMHEGFEWVTMDLTNEKEVCYHDHVAQWLVIDICADGGSI